MLVGERRHLRRTTKESVPVSKHVTTLGFHRTGGKKRSASDGKSAEGVCTLCGAGDAELEAGSFRALTVVDVLSGGDGGVCTGPVEVVDVELGGGPWMELEGVCAGRGDG